MSLNPRCKELLCGLSGPVLTELHALLDVAKTAAATLLTTAVASLAVLDFALAPLLLVKTTVDAVFNEAQQIADLAPVALLLDCLEVGDAYGGVTASLADTQASVDVWLDQLNQKLAFKRRLEDEIEQLQVSIARINDFQVDIADCLGLL